MGINVYWYNSESRADLAVGHWVNWISLVCENYGCLLDEISVVFCTDDELLYINNQVLNHDYYTDIVTFDNGFDGKISGELYISMDRVKDNAEQANCTFKDELDRVLVHGVLHLLGYDDKTADQQSEMRRLENESLELRGVVPRETKSV